MKHIIRTICLVSIAALFATSCYQDDIENLQSQIDNLKSDQIASIESQITSINTTVTGLQTAQSSIKNYISALQEEGKTYQLQIEALQGADKKLGDEIASLKSFTEEELANAKTWVSGTFATIDQVDSLSTVVTDVLSQISALKGELDSAKVEITAKYEQAIKDAISNIEVSLKSWVNEQLTGYYTIAQVNATLDSISNVNRTADSLLSVKIDEQKVALDSAKSQITVAYKAAVQVAIDSLEGKFNKKLTQAIDSTNLALKSEINTIKSSITDIKARLDVVEANIKSLINRIQSVVVIPSYSDGSVRVTGANDIIRFDVRPTSVMDSLVNKVKDCSIFTFKVVNTMTKGETFKPSISVVAASYDKSSGVLSLSVDASGLTNTDYANFFNNRDINMSASLVIKTIDGTECSSSYFPLYGVPISAQLPSYNRKDVYGLFD